MEFSAIYLVQRFFYRIYEFIRHWYAGGFLWFTHHSLTLLEQLDRFFALKVTLRYWFKPLYQDYSVIGYLLGFIFRTCRIIAAGIVYSVVALVSFLMFLLWSAIPIYLIYKGIYGK